MAGEQQREHPMVDGAAINPYDLPGVPRKGDDAPMKDAAPDASETMPVPGPGDPDTTLVEVGGEGLDAMDMADEADDEDAKPKRKGK